MLLLDYQSDIYMLSTRAYSTVRRCSLSSHEVAGSSSISNKNSKHYFYCCFYMHNIFYLKRIIYQSLFESCATSMIPLFRELHFRQLILVSDSNTYLQPWNLLFVEQQVFQTLQHISLSKYSRDLHSEEKKKEKSIIEILMLIVVIISGCCSWWHR